MKKVIYSFAIFLLFISAVLAQNASRGFNFQGIARDLTGNVFADTLIDIKVSIYPEGDVGNPLYTELHNTQTDAYGVFHITIGSVNPSSFGAVDFATANCWVLVESRAGADTYQTVNNMELLSTPYAKVADATTNGVPAGFIMPFAGSKANIPNGWLYCDGSSYDTAGEYAELFATIGFAWGNNGGQFNLPDLRGQFLRGVNDGVGADVDAASRTAGNPGGNTGDNVGSQQAEGYKHNHAVAISVTSPDAGSHVHTYANSTIGTTPDNDNSTVNSFQYPNANDNSETNSQGDHTHTVDVNGNTGTLGANETRPANASVFYIIKYKSR